MSSSGVTREVMQCAVEDFKCVQNYPRVTSQRGTREALMGAWEHSQALRSIHTTREALVGAWEHS